ncbi:MAG: hypothetical protein RBS43_10270, partial [Candidatus Cloacimonas sp.]|nr:hypothetical protein [Candidatus Cloacimonas sp.]
MNFDAQTNPVSSTLSRGGSPPSDSSGFSPSDPVANFFADEPVQENHFNPTVSVGSNIRQPQKLTIWPISDIMFRIQSGTYKVAIEAIRKSEDQEQAKQLKLELPYFVMAELSGGRCDENVIHNTGIVFDFDDVPDTESLAVLLLETMPQVRYIFKSPRAGLKAIILFSKPVSNAALYQRIWKFLAGQVESNTRHKPDNTPDR